MPPKEKVIKEIKQHRKDLDEVLQRIRSGYGAGREQSLAIAKLQESIMWLGMQLKVFNDGQSCYRDGYNPESAKVDPVSGGLEM